MAINSLASTTPCKLHLWSHRSRCARQEGEKVGSTHTVMYKERVYYRPPSIVDNMDLGLRVVLLSLRLDGRVQPRCPPQFTRQIGSKQNSGRINPIKSRRPSLFRFAQFGSDCFSRARGHLMGRVLRPEEESFLNNFFSPPS